MKIELLKAGISSGVVEPALHGYSHQSIRRKNVGLEEFEGLLDWIASQQDVRVFFQDLNYRIIASVVACVGGFAGLWLAATMRPSGGKQFAAAHSRFYSEDAFMLPHPIAGRELVMGNKKRGRL